MNDDRLGALDPDRIPTPESSSEVGGPDADRSSGEATPALQQDKYDQLLQLADEFDRAGEGLRGRARLGDEVLQDEDLHASGELSPRTWNDAEEAIRGATSGKHGLLARSVELDADALVVRATVLTYRWIDDLQEAAYKTLGSIAGRAIGYLAPEVALGGAIVSAGLIETGLVDRDDVASYLNELAENNPDLLDHVSGGGGLLDGLQMRAVLTTSALARATGPEAARAGLRAAQVPALPPDAGSALRDVSGDLTAAAAAAVTTVEAADGGAPRSIEELMTQLVSTAGPVGVRRVAHGCYIAYLPGRAGRRGRIRLVGGDQAAYTRNVVSAIEQAVDGDAGAARVMLVGSAAGGVAAADVAATSPSAHFTVEQVVTAGSPASQAAVLPDGVRILSLEDRADPVALLGSLINEGVSNRLTVIFDGGAAVGSQAYVLGGRAADQAAHPDLRAELTRLTDLGYLAG